MIGVMEPDKIYSNFPFSSNVCSQRDLAVKIRPPCPALLLSIHQNYIYRIYNHEVLH